MICTKIMTDSASDIPKQLETELDIDILSFPITIGDKGYMERVDFTEQEFYEILKTEPHTPTTAQITSFRFMEKYKEYHEKGYDNLVYVAINSKGSGTYHNALMARDEFYETYPESVGKFNIQVVDSKTYTMAYGYAVIEAAKKAQKNIPVQEIVAYLEDWFDSVEVYFAPFTLEFVKKSGRISVAAAFVGELLGLRPIISFIDGEVNIVTKVRGDKAVIPAILKLAQERRVPKTPFALVQGSVDEEQVAFKKIAEKALGQKAEGLYQAGAAICINAGPNMVAIAIKGSRKNG